VLHGPADSKALRRRRAGVSLPCGGKFRGEQERGRSMYTVVAPGWTGTLPGNTPVVLITQAELQTVAGVLIAQAQLQNVPPTASAYALPSSGPVVGFTTAFTFYNSHGAALGTVSLPVNSLDDAAVGSNVLISNGSNWIYAIVENSNATIAAGLPATTRAAFPVVGYVAPTSLSTIPSGYKIIATAKDGEVWFTGAPPFSGIQFYAAAMSTLGAVPGGTAAMVEITAGTFQYVQL
jgi:hypothetical protein